MAIESKLKKDNLFFKIMLIRFRGYFHRLRKSLLSTIIFIGFIVGLVFYLGDNDLVKQSLEIAGTLGFILFIFLFLVTKDDNPIDIALAGAAGESTVLDELKKLDNNFVLYNSVILPDEKSTVGQRELDFVAVSKKAIYVVEVKNNRGYIHVENMAERWEVSKTSTFNKTYSKTIKNPIRQTFAQRKVLQTYLYKNKIYIKGIPVVTVVIFAHEEVELSDNFIAGDANQAVLLLEHLLPFVKMKEDSITEEMSGKSRKKIVKFLERV